MLVLMSMIMSHTLQHFFVLFFVLASAYVAIYSEERALFILNLSNRNYSRYMVLALQNKMIFWRVYSLRVVHFKLCLVADKQK